MYLSARFFFSSFRSRSLTESTRQRKHVFFGQGRFTIPRQLKHQLSYLQHWLCLDSYSQHKAIPLQSFPVHNLVTVTPSNFVELSHSKRLQLRLRGSSLCQTDMIMFDDHVVASRLLLNEVLCLVLKTGISLQLHENRQVAPELVFEHAFEIVDVQVSLCNVVANIEEVSHELGWR